MNEREDKITTTDEEQALTACELKNALADLLDEYRLVWSKMSAIQVIA